MIIVIINTTLPGARSDIWRSFGFQINDNGFEHN